MRKGAGLNRLSLRRRAALLLAVSMLAGTVMLTIASPAVARHNFSMLAVHPTVAGAGDEVAVSGFSYTETAVVRFGALDGPELARLEPTTNNDISGTVRIPPGTAPGRYVLFAMHEDERGQPTRFPGRAAIVVAGPGGPPVSAGTDLALEHRPNEPLEHDAVALSQVVLVGLASAGAGGFLAGVALLALSQRPRRAVREASS